MSSINNNVRYQLDEERPASLQWSDFVAPILVNGANKAWTWIRSVNCCTYGREKLKKEDVQDILEVLKPMPKQIEEMEKKLADLRENANALKHEWNELQDSLQTNTPNDAAKTVINNAGWKRYAEWQRAESKRLASEKKTIKEQKEAEFNQKVQEAIEKKKSKAQKNWALIASKAGKLVRQVGDLAMKEKAQQWHTLVRRARQNESQFPRMDRQSTFALSPKGFSHEDAAMNELRKQKYFRGNHVMLNWSNPGYRKTALDNALKQIPDLEDKIQFLNDLHTSGEWKELGEQINAAYQALTTSQKNRK